jgi:hypothetical protein
MRKFLATTLIAGLFSGAAFAQTTVSSANVVGYVKVDKPGNGKFSIMGVTFTSISQELNSLVDPLQFNGHPTDPSKADQLIFFDAGTQNYSTYALYDIRSYGMEYTSNTAWKALSNFSFSGAAFNPIVAPGSAVWLKGSGSTSNTNVTMVGDVVMTESATNSILMGLQLVSNPFSETVALSNLTLKASATGHPTNPTLADQVIIFNATTQTYTTYALYDISSYGAEYEQYTGWKSITNFTFAGPYADVTLESGQGFWIKATRPFTWVETNKYLGNL